MRLTTEQTKMILTSEQAKKIINYISPIYQHGPMALSTLNAIGTQLDELDEWIGQLWDEINPLTATWSLYLWEQEYGLPNNRSMDVEGRRARLFAKMFTRSRMTPYTIETLVSQLCGREVEVLENTAYRKFDINIQAGASRVNLTAIKKGVDAFKKSHLYYELFTIVSGVIGLEFYSSNRIYRLLICGPEKCGTWPERQFIGKVVRSGMVAKPERVTYIWKYHQCGTGDCGQWEGVKPVGMLVRSPLATNVKAPAYVWDYPRCGTTGCGRL